MNATDQPDASLTTPPRKDWAQRTSDWLATPKGMASLATLSVAIVGGKAGWEHIKEDGYHPQSPAFTSDERAEALSQFNEKLKNPRYVEAMNYFINNKEKKRPPQLPFREFELNCRTNLIELSRLLERAGVKQFHQTFLNNGGELRIVHEVADMQDFIRRNDPEKFQHQPPAATSGRGL